MKRFKKVLPLVLCLCAFSVVALGSGSEDGSPAAQKVGEVGSAETGNVFSSDSTSTGVQTDKFEYVVGETFTKNGLNLTYASSGVFISDNQFMQPKEGNQYIQLTFHVDNQSGSDKSVTSFEFKCYADGYNCDSVYFADNNLSASLSSGRSADGVVCFEVPVDAQEIEIEYEYDMFADKKVKFLYQGEKDSGLVFEKNTSVSENAFHVGDIIENKNLRITYLKASKYVSDNMFFQPAEGNKYIYIELEVENLSNSDKTISYLLFDCYADGSGCSGFYGLNDSLSATISSGRKAKGTVAFEVPEDAQVVEIEFEDNLWSENKIIFLYEE